MKIYTKISVMILFSIFVCSCTDPDVNLGYGYKYIALDGINHAIVSYNDDLAVDPDVYKYKVYSFYVLGMRRDANIDDRLSKKYGYFIINMKNKKLIEGLNKDDFEKELNSRGIPNTDFCVNKYEILNFCI